MLDLRQLLTTRHPNWKQRLLRGFMALAVPAHAAAVWLRNQLYDWQFKKTFRVGVPVISVGNLSVGGTGKSPVVAWIARWLRDQDVRVAILSRGYGALESGQNDEALELELQFPDVPHLQNRDRVAAAELAVTELEMQVLLLDDAMQHRRLHRDLEIVLIDASEAACARRMLPLGLLREPMSSLGRAHVVMLTRSDQANPSELLQLQSAVQRAAPMAKLLHAIHRPQELLCFPESKMPLESLRKARVLAFCGIGNPPSFFQGLESLGATIVQSRVWPDHHAFQREDIQWLENWVRETENVDYLLCTVKDWVKIQEPELGGKPLLALQIGLQITSGQEDLVAALKEISTTAKASIV